MVNIPTLLSCLVTMAEANTEPGQGQTGEDRTEPLSDPDQCAVSGIVACTQNGYFYENMGK